MAQIQSPENYIDGQQVTATRLNNQTNGAILLPGAITDQTSLPSNTVASNDQVLLHDISSSSLRSATAGDLLGSGLPVSTTLITADTVVTSDIDGKTSKSVFITPNAGVLVSGAVFSSGNGVDVTVTQTNHGLLTGQILDFTASNSAYNGKFAITVLNTTAFTYKLTTSTTGASGTINYTPASTTVNNGNVYVEGMLHTKGNTLNAGNVITSGDTTCKGNLSIAGTTTMNGTATLNGVPLGSGVFLGYTEENIVKVTANTGAANVLHTMFTSLSYTKPVGEVWVCEIEFIFYTPTASYIHYRLGDNLDAIDYVSSYISTENLYTTRNISHRFVLPSSNTHNGVFVLRSKLTQNSITISPDATQLIGGNTNSTTYPDRSRGTTGKFRIYKYKP